MFSPVRPYDSSFGNIAHQLSRIADALEKSVELQNTLVDRGISDADPTPEGGNRG